MIVSCIVATAENMVIGKGNKIPWYLSADLKYFKRTTLNHPIIMGRKCFDSIGKPLPKRTNIIVTRNPFFIVSNCLVTNEINDALGMAYDTGAEEAFIIGGGEIYNQTKALWDRLYWTKVHANIDGDVYFPEINLDEWIVTKEERHAKDDKNDFDYSFFLLDRK